jgi:hypothetical protein
MTFSDVFNTQEEVFAEWYTGSFTFVVPNVVSKSSRLTNMTDHYFIDSILSPLRTAIHKVKPSDIQGVLFLCTP